MKKRWSRLASNYFLIPIVRNQFFFTIFLRLLASLGERRKDLKPSRRWLLLIVCHFDISLWIISSFKVAVSFKQPSYLLRSARLLRHSTRSKCIRCSISQPSAFFPSDWPARCTFRNSRFWRCYRKSSPRSSRATCARWLARGSRARTSSTPNCPPIRLIYRTATQKANRPHRSTMLEQETA